MKKLKKILIWLISILAILYLVVATIFYFKQEKLLFMPQKLAADYVFDYPDTFEELYLTTDDNIKLHGLFFKSDSSRGLVFYLHGNAGSLKTWGRVAKPFLDNNYDCFVLDYRGYGKSEGRISSEEQLLNDVSFAYDKLTKEYSEDSVILVGYSMGSGPAAYLASIKRPKLLILKAPYFSMSYMRQIYFNWLPEMGLRYKLRTNEYLAKAKLPITIIHGDEDEIIPYESSIKLKKLFDGDDELVTLPGQSHHPISQNPDYIAAINKILN